MKLLKELSSLHEGGTKRAMEDAIEKAISSTDVTGLSYEQAVKKLASRAQDLCSIPGSEEDFASQISDVYDREDHEAVKEDVEQITEAAEAKTRYETSDEFDADMDKLQSLISQAKALVTSSAWKKHLRDTDLNFDTSAIEMARRAEEKLKWAEDAYAKLYDHITEKAV